MTAPAANIRDLTIGAIPLLRDSMAKRKELWPDNCESPWCHRDVLAELMRGYEDRDQALAKLAAVEAERDGMRTLFAQKNETTRRDGRGG